MLRLKTRKVGLLKILCWLNKTVKRTPFCTSSPKDFITNFEAREIGVVMFGSSVNLGLLCLLAMTHAPQDSGWNEIAGVHHPAPSLARCTLAKVFSLPLIPCQSPGFIFNLLERRLCFTVKWL